uniref:Secreted protein n=1 Tax=Catagonus wagneri TaxID=51154 RepID=A0A8C3X918_9CETA
MVLKTWAFLGLFILFSILVNSFAQSFKEFSLIEWRLYVQVCICAHRHCVCELVFPGLFLESNTQYYPSVTRTAQYLVLDLRTYQLNSQHASCLQLLNSTVNLQIVPRENGHVDPVSIQRPHMCHIRLDSEHTDTNQEFELRYR